MTPVRRGKNLGLWILQGLLTGLFLFSGVMKFVLPPAVLTQGSSLSVGFIRFIGVMEILGALGLVLPGAFGIARRLTPMAAAGLLIIMVGATIITAIGPQAATAPLPAIIGVLVTVVLVGRRSWASVI